MLSLIMGTSCRDHVHFSPSFSGSLIVQLVYEWAYSPLGSWALQWRHNGCDGVSNHQRLCCLPNRLFRRWSKKTSKLRVTVLCEGNSPVTGEFPSQKASNVKMFPFDDVIMIFETSKFESCANPNLKFKLSRLNSFEDRIPVGSPAKVFVLFVPDVKYNLS